MEKPLDHPPTELAPSPYAELPLILQAELQSFQVTAETAAPVATLPGENWGSDLTQPHVIIPAAILFGAALGASAYHCARKWTTNWRTSIQQRRAAEAKADQPTERTLSKAGTKLVLQNMLAHVAITKTDGDEMSLTVNGKRRRVDDVQLVTSANTLTLKGAARNLDYFPVSVLGRTGRMTSWILKKMAKKLGLEFVDESDWLQVQAVVPAGTNLVLDGVDGNVLTQVPLGDVRAKVAASRTMTLDRAQNVDLNSGSHSTVTIKCINGPLRAQVGYDSRVKVVEGVVSPLKANISSYGKLNVGADAKDARVDCGYNSTAQLSSASGNVWMRTASYAKTQTTGGSASAVTLIAGYNSLAAFRGTTSSANLSSESYAHLELGEINGPLSLQGGYNSMTNVGLGEITDARIILGSYSRFDFGGHIKAGTLNVGYDSRVTAASYGDDVRIQKGAYAHVVRGKSK